MTAIKKLLLLLVILLVSVTAYAVVIIDEDYVFNETVTISDLTASQPVVSNASKVLVSTPYNTFAGNIDHGLLLGLSDDDHTQYHTDARALTWLGTRSTSDLPEGTNLYFTDEKAQDAVGGILANGSDIHLTYSDGTPSISSTLTLTGVTNGSYGAADSVGTFTVDLKGRLTAAANAAISILAAAVSDFTEAAQDSIGAMVDSSLIYTDGGPTLSRAALTGDITASQGSNSTTLATVNSNVGTFGSATQVSQVTVNAKGLTTAASNVSIAIPSTQVSDFTEAAQDAVGAMVDSTLVYTDGTPLLSRAALTGDITASSGSNATTLATVNSNVGSFGSSTQSAVPTVNGKGLITAISNTTITPAVGSITGLGTGVATWLATPSSANLRSAVTDETGSGALVFATSPTLVTPAIGAATGTSLVLTGSLTSNALTAGRVPFAGTSGILQDDADMTFATDTLTVANVVGSSEVRMGNGLVNNPSLAFDSDTDTGIYRVSANILGVTTATVQSAQFEELAVSSGSAQGWRLRNVTASSTVPSLVPNQSDTNTGIGWENADELALIADGTEVAMFSPTIQWVPGSFGVGTSQPSAIFEVSTEIANNSIRAPIFGYYADDNVAANMNLRKSRGTKASPTAVNSGDILGGFAGQGYSGAAYTNGGTFQALAAANWTSTSTPGILRFSTTATSATSVTERMRIDNSGNIGVGITSFGTSAAKVIAIGNGTAPSTSPADGVQLYAQDVAASSELRVRDEAGSVTTLSPHNFSRIPGGRSEPMAWSFYSERDNKYINVDMLKLARAVEKCSGEKLVYEGNTK